ncbi:peptide chain release factor N(5)-glutamine methyltransferase [Alysiella filiformis]|uniref:Release factor glutamine methyltransferase n=1 Tax=Alysiella filiformis DSM 16848 TaxID=1120981 RepID=A0A286ECY0_9NEIS|nr:peptide chain release factor N(5)-glutamine methyltransferase [Alysiella filiformis]QMT31904.1 peptide chain release factor N(5)-glutamine methyltransferase [Alysiella filiformis]UBQ57190.1 peptide chain release factor N(5)-glutamine methyltransferase [Alysiella filiformis DSM 16848]SOD68730.1 release factor glutamine methyltransferase [Alysiella filiformis DSM 16848]
MINQTLLQWIQQSPLPKLETRLLLQHITGYTRAQLLTRDTEKLPENQAIELHNLIERRKCGEPIAYILGEREFYGRNFRVSPAVLIPRPETEHLLEAALCRLPENGTLWDLGTGSGIIAISAKLERPDVLVFASDVSDDALQIAQSNAHNLGADVAFGQGWWFQAAGHFRLPECGCDVIVSNPPYIEQHDGHLAQGDLRFEPPHALTDFADGLAHIREIAAQAPDYLKENAWLMLEHGYNQGQAVREILQQNGFRNVATLPDLAGLDRVSVGQFQAA